MAVELKFLIDGADRGQPLNPEDFAVTINEDDSIGARVVSFNNDLTFDGGVYEYLYTKLSTFGYCELVDVSVLYQCKSGWAKLVDGYIVVTESVFNLDRCQVNTKLYDETFSTKINNNKGIPFSLLSNKTKNLSSITPPQFRSLRLFNPANGAYGLSGYGTSIYKAFKHLVGCMSDNLVDFESDYFRRDESIAQTNFPIITNGLSIRSDQVVEVVISFEQLFTVLRNKLNLGMGFEKQANGRPLLRIEPIEYFFQSTPSVNLYDQPNITMQFDTKSLYAAVQFGSNPFLEANQCNGGETACTFTQTPFRGFREERFGFTGECNTSNILQVGTGDVIFDTNVIEDIYRFNATDYDTSNIIIQSDFEIPLIGTPYYQAIPYDPYSIGQTVYNGIYTNNEVSANWLSGYPNSLYSFLEGFDESLTPFTANKSTAQTFDVIFPTFTGFLEFTGNFLVVNEVTDAGNNFDNQTYRVPFAGIYTFIAQIVSEPVGLFTGTRTGYATVMHYDFEDSLITQYEGAQETEPNIDPLICNVQAQIVCNAGDLIRVNYYVRQNSPGPAVTESVKPSVTDGGTLYFTSFGGDGVNINPLELDPVDIDAVRAYLYKFNRPLSMDEISAIMAETSKPILLGRRDDALAVIDTYIKTINIKSVLRKSADFELKSNKLLP